MWWKRFLQPARSYTKQSSLGTETGWGTGPLGGSPSARRARVRGRKVSACWCRRWMSSTRTRILSRTSQPGLCNELADLQPKSSVRRDHPPTAPGCVPVWHQQTGQLVGVGDNQDNRRAARPLSGGVRRSSSEASANMQPHAHRLVCSAATACDRPATAYTIPLPLEPSVRA